MQNNKIGYRALNQKSLDESKAEVWLETGMTLTEIRKKAGRVGGKISAFSRFGNKTKAQISEMMKRVRKGEKIKGTE